MPDYSNAKIYKLVSDKTAMIYIGSTTVKLHQRLSGHRYEFKKNIDVITSKKLFELGGNISIELIKLFPCNCRKELEKEEGKYIRQYGNICINKCVAGGTKKEWYQNNKEKIKEIKKKYYENNKQKIKEIKKNIMKIINKNIYVSVVVKY
jgi:hypothetical protein